MNDKVYIIIVTYNAESWIEYFAPAFSGLPDGWRVLIIDNASLDSTVELVSTRYEHFVLIKNRKNIGFGGANNIGLQIALRESADYVFLLNQDARISVESIKKMILVHKKNPEYLVLSPIHLCENGSDLDYSFASYCHPYHCPHMYSDAIKKNDFQDVYPIKQVNAAAWLLSSQCLSQIGGFNPSFFHYGEDDEYLQRVLFHKKLIGVIPSCFVEHARKSSLFDANVKRYIKNTFLVEYFNQLKSNSFDKMLMHLTVKLFKAVISFSPRTAFCIFLVIVDLLNNRSKIMNNKKLASTVGATFLYSR